MLITVHTNLQFAVHVGNVHFGNIVFESIKNQYLRISGVPMIIPHQDTQVIEATSNVLTYRCTVFF